MEKNTKDLLEELGKTTKQLALTSDALYKVIQSLVDTEETTDEPEQKAEAETKKAPAATDAKKYTHEDALKALAAYAAVDKKAARKLLNDYGAKKLKDLDPSKYGEVTEAANKAVAALKEKEADAG